MKSHSSKHIISMLHQDGWFYIGAVGDHYQFKHPTKKGRVTVTHPQKDIPAGTVRSIFKQAGWPQPK
ncbi:MAG TPA: type II toxin-antitoxin system HicA family toxin [Spirochaetia bacterium]|nr:type II toxin-antitoxin system HicA family toxin [Spirochaetia bacterium]